MYGHSNEERREKIIEYVKAHPRTTKRKVVEYLHSEQNNKMSSLLTTRKLLDELISSKRINLATDTLGGRNHYLSYNDEDIFNKVVEDIANVQTFVESLKERLGGLNNPLVQAFKDEIIFRDIMLQFYLRMSIIAQKIKSGIASVQDRDFLNLRLAQVLFDSYTLSSILSGEYVHDLRSLKPESKQDKFVNDVVGWALRHLR